MDDKLCIVCNMETVEAKVDICTSCQDAIANGVPWAVKLYDDAREEKNRARRDVLDVATYDPSPNNLGDSTMQDIVDSVVGALGVEMTPGTYDHMKHEAFGVLWDEIDALRRKGGITLPEALIVLLDAVQMYLNEYVGKPQSQGKEKLLQRDSFNQAIKKLNPNAPRYGKRQHAQLRKQATYKLAENRRKMRGR